MYTVCSFWSTLPFQNAKYPPHSKNHSSSSHLLLLNTTAIVLLRLLNRRLVTLDLTLVHEAVASLEWPLQITGGRLAEDMNLDQVRLERALERDDRLDQERVGVLEVQVHHAHHANAHQLALDQLAQLRLIVVHVGRRHGTGFLAATHRSGFDVFEGRHVWTSGC